MNPFSPMRITALLVLATILISFVSIVQIQAAEEDTVPHLISKLKSGDTIKREEAAYALGESSDPRALEPLLEVLQNQAEDGQVRMSAAMALGSLADCAAVEPLIEFVRVDMEKRTGIIAAGIGALGELKDPRAVPILLKALNNRAEDWLYREMAARTLGSIGDRRAVDDLISAAYMGDTRHDAIAALAQIGDAKAVETLIRALDDGEEQDTVQAARTGLLKIGSPAVTALIKEMEDFPKEYPRVQPRANIAGILGELGDSRAIEALENAVKDPSAEVRQAARIAVDLINSKGLKKQPGPSLSSAEEIY